MVEFDTVNCSFVAHIPYRITNNSKAVRKYENGKIPSATKDHITAENRSSKNLLDLPNELLNQVCDYLPSRDLFAVAGRFGDHLDLTCKRLYEIATSKPRYKVEKDQALLVNAEFDRGAWREFRHYETWQEEFKSFIGNIAQGILSAKKLSQIALQVAKFGESGFDKCYYEATRTLTTGGHVVTPPLFFREHESILFSAHINAKTPIKLSQERDHYVLNQKNNAVQICDPNDMIYDLIPLNLRLDRGRRMDIEFNPSTVRLTIHQEGHDPVLIPHRDLAFRKACFNRLCPTFEVSKENNPEIYALCQERLNKLPLFSNDDLKLIFSNPKKIARCLDKFSDYEFSEALGRKLELMPVDIRENLASAALRDPGNVMTEGLCYGSNFFKPEIEDQLIAKGLHYLDGFNFGWIDNSSTIIAVWANRNRVSRPVLRRILEADETTSTTASDRGIMPHNESPEILQAARESVGLPPLQ